MMDSILRETEAYQFFTCGGLFRQPKPGKGNGVENAVSSAIAQLSRDLMVRCIVVSTHTGYTVSMVSSDRPLAPIISLTSSDQALRKLLVIWGVFPYLVRRRIEGSKSFAFAETLMKRMKLADSGDFLLMIAGTGGINPSGMQLQCIKLPDLSETGRSYHLKRRGENESEA